MYIVFVENRFKIFFIRLFNLVLFSNGNLLGLDVLLSILSFVLVLVGEVVVGFI